jgi:UTP--glucose-1-phosphate uridylyltransferase
MAVKGVIVAAGYGTRFLPVTRCVPKEMLPIVDRPAIDFIVAEMAEAGIEDILVITSRRKRALEDWFDRDPELEAVFTREGASAKLAKAQPPKVRVHFVRQQEMRGTGHAILQAQVFAGDDPVVVAYPDDLFGAPNCSAALIDAWRQTGNSVLSAVDMSGHDVSRYGCIAFEGSGPVVTVRDLVEKPPPGSEPSTLVSMGRYLYTPDIFPVLEALLRAHDGGEFYATDAVSQLAAQGQVSAAVVSARRYDTGTPLAYLQTVVTLALEHPEIGAEFGDFLDGLRR